ncbi:MAG: hypothetical protein M3O70_25755 [Actinomycetota bacterium]|nr:hypothetical protein [Actinomycetota bacterium]
MVALTVSVGWLVYLAIDLWDEHKRAIRELREQILTLEAERRAVRRNAGV